MEFVDFSSPKARAEYESFVNNHPQGSFTQSLCWCDVKQGWQHEAVIVRDENQKIIAAMLVLVKRIPFLRTAFFYSPRGPVCDLRNVAVLAELYEGIRILARKYRAYLFKCDPMVEAQDHETIECLRRAGFILQHDEQTIQCRDNYILDIKDKTQDEVFESFHNKWRYNIRLSERKGVTCEYYETCPQDKLDDFYKLMVETGERDGFLVRPKEYFKAMIDSFHGGCRLYLCYYQGEPVSAAITVQYAKKTCYVYGASSGRHRNVMPNHLMQWNMIKWAIESKNDIYDFQNIPNYDDETHPKYGIYRFKKGFNGRVVNFAGEFDVGFSAVKRKMVELGIFMLKLANRLQYKLSKR